MLFSMGGGGGERAGNAEAAAFGATVSDALRTPTIVWWWGEGGTMESGANADVWFAKRRIPKNRVRSRPVPAERFAVLEFLVPRLT